MTTPRRQQKAAIPANTGIAAYLNGDDRGNFGLDVSISTIGLVVTAYALGIAVGSDAAIFFGRGQRLTGTLAIISSKRSPIA
jgi:hypothetical protein